MAKPKNAYLAKKAREREANNFVIMQWSHQMCYDALVLVLNDAEVMGKDVFGKKRLEKLADALNAKITEMLPGVSGAVNASHVRRQVDDELRRICGEDFPSWEERYPFWDDRGI